MYICNLILNPKNKTKSKKGAGDAISALILFIAVLGVSLGVVVAFQQLVVKTQDTLSDQQEFTQNSLRTQLIISNIFYDVNTNEVDIYVRNIGKTTLASSYFTFFIDGEYGVNLTPSFATNQGVPITVLHPQETMYVEFPIVLSVGSHELTVVSEYGNVVKETFNVE